MRMTNFLPDKVNTSDFRTLFTILLLCVATTQLNALGIKTTTINAVGEWPDVVRTATNVIGDYVEVSFDGTGIIWEAVKWDNAGMVEITLDGEVVDKMDLFGGVWERTTWEKYGLEAGYHTLRITLIDEKNPESPDHWINLFGRFTVIDPWVKETGDGWSTKGEGWGGLGLPSNCVVGEYIEVPFRGTGVIFNYLKFRDGGVAQVTIDGEDMGEIDFYDEQGNVPDKWTKEGLEDDAHVLRITITDKHHPNAVYNEDAGGYFINYLGFETVGTTITESGIDWDIDPSNNSFVTNIRTATVDVTFEGHSIRLLSVGTDYGGIASISVDGGEAEELNQLSDGINVPVIWEKTKLQSGTHNLRITMAESSPQGSYINYIAFEQVARAIPPDPVSINSEKVADENFTVLPDRMLVLNDEYVGKELQINMYTFTGATIYRNDVRVTETSQEILLPEVTQPVIILINENGRRVFSQKYVVR